MLCALFACRIVAHAAPPVENPATSKNILLLYSYGHGSQGVGIFDDGFLQRMSVGGYSTSQLFFEYLDLERNRNDPNYRLRMQDLLDRKYRGRQIDLIVTVQQPALTYLLDEGTGLAQDAPVISVQAPMPSASEVGKRRVVSELAAFDMKGTLERALELFPNTRRVVFVSGASEADRNLSKQAASVAQPWQGRLEFEYTTEISLDAMLKRVASLPERTIIIFTQYNRDVSGKVAIAYEVEAAIIKAANAPVFGLYDFNLVNGGIGGSVVGVKSLGESTGMLALDLLNGRRQLTQSVTSVGISAFPMFDWEQIKRWDGDASKLSGNPVFVNRVPTFWDLYKFYVVGVAAFILVQSMLIAILVRNRRRRKMTEHALKKSEARLRLMFDHASDGIVTMSASGKLLVFNEAFSRMHGYTDEEMSSLYLKDLATPETSQQVPERMQRVLSGQEMMFDVEHYHKDGHVIALEVSATVIVLEGEPVIQAFHRDVTKHRQSEQQIQRLAFSDPLTGLPNRRLLMDRLEQAIAAAHRQAQQLALLFIDLDNFKTLNDTLGHDKGDLLLRQVATRLTACVREGDTVARLGGDEFIVLLSDLSSDPHQATKQAQLVTAKILDALGQPYQLDGHGHHSTVSVGVSLFGGAVRENIEEPLKRAELAMYQAKGAGRNTMRFFEPEMQTTASDRATLEAELREAVNNNQFVLYYQPQGGDNVRLTGAEALLRWQHPQHGSISPAAFIPVAEASGLILPLGQWVLQTACKQLAAWSARPEMAHLTMAVNVSARQFRQPDFVAEVVSVLHTTGVKPERLKLELTESVLVDNVEDIIIKMTALKASGVGFSLDDFGTGYSSLSYLKRLPLDQLKIDQSFVRDILTDPNDAAIAKMVIVLAESLGLEVIAEGVETVAQRDFLANMGCHAYQGYLFSRPLPIDEFETLAKLV